MPNLEVNSIQLIDAKNDIVLFDITDGQQIDLDKLPTSFLSIQATANGLTESLLFELNGALNKTHTENIAPYTLFADNMGKDFYGADFNLGSYTLTVTPYALDKLQGDHGTPITINFSLRSSTLPVVYTATLIRPDVGTNNNPDEEIRALTDNEIIDLVAEGGGDQYPCQCIYNKYTKCALYL